MEAFVLSAFAGNEVKRAKGPEDAAWAEQQDFVEERNQLKSVYDNKAENRASSSSLELMLEYKKLMLQLSLGDEF